MVMFSADFNNMSSIRRNQFAKIKFISEIDKFLRFFFQFEILSRDTNIHSTDHLITLISLSVFGIIESTAINFSVKLLSQVILSLVVIEKKTRFKSNAFDKRSKSCYLYNYG